MNKIYLGYDNFGEEVFEERPEITNLRDFYMTERDLIEESLIDAMSVDELVMALEAKGMPPYISKLIEASVARKS